MPKGTNQKFKLYRLAQIMLEKQMKNIILQCRRLWRVWQNTISQLTGKVSIRIFVT